jgi:hypothetical protein
VSPQEGPTEVRSQFERSVDEGEERLGRTWPGQLATGLVGGIDIGIGLFALLLVMHATGSLLLGGPTLSVHARRR